LFDRIVKRVSSAVDRRGLLNRETEIEFLFFEAARASFHGADNDAAETRTFSRRKSLHKGVLAAFVIVDHKDGRLSRIGLALECL